MVPCITNGTQQRDCNHKNQLYVGMHRDNDATLVPLVASAHGPLTADSIVLTYTLAHKTAEHYYEELRWDIHNPATGKQYPGFLCARARFFTSLRFKAWV
jgi:hypothetical protein